MIRPIVRFALTALLSLSATRAEELLKNGGFLEFAAGALPEDWIHRTKDQPVSTKMEGGANFVRVEVGTAGMDNFIQQNVSLGGKKGPLKLTVKYRHAGIVAGAKRHQRGTIASRFTKNGTETGPWISLADPVGDSDGWVEKNKVEPVPDGADGLLVRFGFYGAKSGALDIAMIGARSMEPASATTEENFRPTAPFGPPVDPARSARLSKGVNLSHWFAQAYNANPDGIKGDYSAAHFARWITDKDADLIKNAGLDHVRLNVEIAEFMGEDGSLKPKFLPDLDAAIQRFVSRGIAVKLDIHPKGDFKQQLKGKEMQDRFARFWSVFAGHLSATDPGYVFLEILNEPSIGGAAWSAIQDRLITVIRKSAPHHTIIANPGNFQRLEDYENFTPHPDRNVIYASHYYSPSPFTHQGALWMKDWYHPLRDIPWPLTEKELPAAIGSLDRQGENAGKAKKSAKVLSDIVSKKECTAEQIQQDFAKLAAWSKKHDRTLVIGEFGVSRSHAPLDSLLRWTAAVRTAAHSNGIGWTVWDYAGEFAIVNNPGKPGARTPNEEMLKALGL